MKKILLAITLIFSLCTFAACNGNKGTDSGEALETETTTVTTTATTTETTTITTTETTTETTAEPETDSPWELLFYVDEFKRQTDDPFIFGEFYGTFSNSATTNSNLSAAFSIERYVYNDEIYDTLRIYLYEYGSHLVKNPYSKSKHYDIQVLEENDNVIKTTEYMFSEGNYIYVSEDKDQNQIINALKNNNTLIFRIDEEDSLDTYFFEVDCTGFKELFESTDWSV